MDRWLQSSRWYPKLAVLVSPKASQWLFNSKRCVQSAKPWLKTWGSFLITVFTLWGPIGITFWLIFCSLGTYFRKTKNTRAPMAPKKSQSVSPEQGVVIRETFSVPFFVKEFNLCKRKGSWNPLGFGGNFESPWALHRDG